ncbi:SAGA complex subunit Ngg1 [Schizosaccharomyces cryophilus OY26]|uniref:SAGA complex subunit Ngg1 n=1 Tax=Schizosaccharomyces cryophilus (strain OY26 / ATCC MYA-4695 / CBS 11777 / NBRC 106824 / NRRL Y48691) TaxID=653667 RepID=S9VSK2_SCHCR|nr:SAGA complex subunit Ngg1 [Schizosaccharomyces cryophilus OY26]EPY49169.1 SAGA complex subunit Ngg1 [Schizosaccharomyces cryophilus OY26]
MSFNQKTVPDNDSAVSPPDNNISIESENFLSALNEISNSRSVPDVSMLWKLLFELQKISKFNDKSEQFFSTFEEQLQSSKSPQQPSTASPSSVHRSSVSSEIDQEKEKEKEEKRTFSSAFNTQDSPSILKKRKGLPTDDKVDKPVIEEKPDEQRLEISQENIDLPVKSKDDQVGACYKSANELATGSLISFIVDDHMTYEEKKELLCISSFPKKDVRCLVAGTPVTEDFSNSKPNNQISISTFYSFLDPYFRSFDDEDVNFLRETSDVSKSYQNPPLGERYPEVPQEDDIGKLCAASIYQNLKTVPHGSLELLQEVDTVGEDISCGPLTERLLASLLPDDDVSSKNKVNSIVNGTDNAKDSHVKKESLEETDNEKEEQHGMNDELSILCESDFSFYEERLRNRLRSLGVIYDDDIDWTKRQDDQISETLRSLQDRLKKTEDANQQRKQKILELLPEEMAFQEFSSVLDDLDKQIENAYMKRNRTLKVKKKRIVNEKINASATSSYATIKSLMDKRSLWLEKLQPLFYRRLQSDCLRPPDSVFISQDEKIMNTSPLYGTNSLENVDYNATPGV